MCWTLNHQNIIEMVQGHISLSSMAPWYAVFTMNIPHTKWRGLWTIRGRSYRCRCSMMPSRRRMVASPRAFDSNEQFLVPRALIVPGEATSTILGTSWSSQAWARASNDNRDTCPWHQTFSSSLSPPSTRDDFTSWVASGLNIPWSMERGEAPHLYPGAKSAPIDLHSSSVALLGGGDTRHEMWGAQVYMEEGVPVPAPNNRAMRGRYGSLLGLRVAEDGVWAWDPPLTWMKMADEKAHTPGKVCWD
jgi:hypothetical protein